MPTGSQDRAFAEAMKDSIDEIKMSSATLDTAIEWIQDNLNPDDVFSEKDILAYAQNFDPEAVFNESTLSAWAESNGYIKE